MPAEFVVLLDDSDIPCGTADKALVHHAETPLHLAFSCYLENSQGEVLLTRRATSKSTWPGVWTNSVCGHPAPGEDPLDAVQRRVGTELGARAADLSLRLPDFRYRAVDAGGVVENEVCPVYVGRLVGPLRPDPAEVAEYRWLPWPELARIAALAPWLISPWAALQVPLLRPLQDGPLQDDVVAR